MVSDIMNLEDIEYQLEIAISDLLKFAILEEQHILVVGASTSEVLGKRIGSAGSDDVAKTIFDTLKKTQKKYNFNLAFQSCEHINRALVVENQTAEKFNLDVVSVVPFHKAGGALSTYAYNHFKDPVVVEHVKADAGIDIGDTFIGMHLKQVAVPVRSTITEIGDAHLSMARTRPKYIGGERARY